MPTTSNEPQALRILFATVSGNARQVAEAIAMEAADGPRFTVEVVDMHDIENSGELETDGPLLLLCVATTGSGDVPDDAQCIYGSLLSNPRYLGGLKYGLIALGDSSYGNTYCGGAMQFDAVLQDLGASRIGEILRIDAMEEPEPERAAVQWFTDWKKTAFMKQ